MGSYDKDNIPMLSDTHPRSVDENADSQFQAYISSNRSASFSIPMNYMESYETESNLVGFTGPLHSRRRTPELQMSGPLYINRKSVIPLGENQSVSGGQKVEIKAENFSFKGMDQNDWTDNNYGRNEHLLKSGQLGMCNDPYCTTCPSYYHSKAAQHKHSRASSIFDPKHHSVLYGDAKGWARRFVCFVKPCVPGVMNPHAKVVERWNKFFVISCLLAIFIDPLFFLLLSVQKDNKCIVIDWHMTTTIVVFRSLTDFVCLLNMLLQIKIMKFTVRQRAQRGREFRLAYVAPESGVVGTGVLVDNPKKIAMNYLKGWFLIDLFIALPLPQIIVLLVLPDVLGSSGANYAKNLLRAAVLIQYIPRLYRFLPLLVGQSPSGLIFETAWANFVINLLTYMLAAHVVGSCWYLFGLQRVNQCLRDACHNSDIKRFCESLIDCGHGISEETVSSPSRDIWKNNTDAQACFTATDISYGIYAEAVGLTSKHVITRYVYSLFWGFQQISTLAGNQAPSYFVWEVLFTMGIIGLGLLLFALLIGNMQNFLQALGQRRLEMSLRRRDVEQWMRHRGLPQELRRKVVEAERYNWAATRGVNEDTLLENLPEDLQRDIRRHLFKFVKKVWIFALMDDHILDVICKRLRQTIYIKGGEIFYHGGAVEKMVFIVRGKLESIGEDGHVFPLSEGNVCGEELITWCLEHSSVGRDGKKIKNSGQRLLGSRTVRCLTNVEAFTLRAADLEEVTSFYARSLRNPRIQGALRYQSPYWRAMAASRIQVAWRYRQKCLKRSRTSRATHCSN